MLGRKPRSNSGTSNCIPSFQMKQTNKRQLILAPSHKPHVSNPRLIKEEADLMRDFSQAKCGIEDPTQQAGKTNVTEIQKIQGTLMKMGMKLKGVKVEQDKMAKQIQELRGTLSEIYGSEATQK